MIWAGDPHVIKSTRIDAIYGLVGLMDDSYYAMRGLRTPTLLLYGANDEVVPPKPIVKSAQSAVSVVTAVYYRQGYHMLLRDTERDIPLGDIVSWVTDSTQPLPSGGALTPEGLERAIKK